MIMLLLVIKWFLFLILQAEYICNAFGSLWLFGRPIPCFPINFYKENDLGICNEWKYCSFVCFQSSPMDMFSRNYQNFMEYWVLAPTTHQCQFIPTCPCFLTLHGSSKSSAFNRGMVILWMFVEMRCINGATFTFLLMYGILNGPEMYGLIQCAISLVYTRNGSYFHLCSLYFEMIAYDWS